jgi:hypothetical protein
MKPNKQQQKLADDARLLRAWKRWHCEQLEEALAGMHRDVLGRLITQLKQLRSARELIKFIEAQDWNTIDYNTRLIALHEINNAITKFRELNGLPPIDDPLPGAHANAFLRIKEYLFPRKAEKHAGDSPAKQRHDIGENNHVK